MSPIWKNNKQIGTIKNVDPRLEKITRLEPLLERIEDSAIRAVAFNPDNIFVPDGKGNAKAVPYHFMALACDDNNARIFRFDGHKVLPFFELGEDADLKRRGVTPDMQNLGIPHPEAVTAALFCPGGDLITGCFDGRVRTFNEHSDYETSSGSLGNIVRGISFSHDYIAACDRSGITLFSYDEDKGLLLRPAVHEAYNDCSSVSFSPNGRFILAGNLNGKARLYEFNGKKFEKKLEKGFSAGINAVAFNRFGNHAAFGANDKYAIIYTFDFAQGFSRACEQKMKGRVNSVAFSHDGKYFAATFDNVLKIFGVRHS